MNLFKKILVLLLSLTLVACGDTEDAQNNDATSGADTSSSSSSSGGDVSSSGGDASSSGGDTTTMTALYRGQHTHTLLMGMSDNAEVVKTVPGTSLVALVSSKARKVSLLRVNGEALEIVRERALFSDDATESELTHIDINADGSWAVLTRTLLETDASGTQTGCGGELVFIDMTDSDTFGDVISQVTVGPMPDSVDISDDGSLVASANERDGLDAWGKCEIADATASISLIDLSGGVAAASEVLRVEMVDGDTGPREPESIVIAPDNDLIVATLQDSHELAMFRRSDFTGVAQATSAEIEIIALPVNDLGAGPWPDGVGQFTIGAANYFVTAGEWNDTFSVLDATGQVVSTTPLTASDIPETFPRVVDEGSPLFSPDSIVSFERGGRVYVAFSLRHSGAVAIYEVTDPAAPAFTQVIAVGDNEQGGADADGSTIRPEGITAAADGGFIVTANEAESSVSLIIPLP